METLTPTARKTIREKQPTSFEIGMLRDLVLLLALAGLAYALEPTVIVKEYPHAALHADGTQEYYFNYGLLASNPSEKDWMSFIAHYSLPAGIPMMETDESFREKKRLANSGTIQSGQIKPRANFSYYYRITPPKASVRA